MVKVKDINKQADESEIVYLRIKDGAAGSEDGSSPEFVVDGGALALVGIPLLILLILLVLGYYVLTRGPGDDTRDDDVTSPTTAREISSLDTPLGEEYLKEHGDSPPRTPGCLEEMQYSVDLDKVSRDNEDRT